MVSQGHHRPWVDQRSLLLSSSCGPLPQAIGFQDGCSCVSLCPSGPPHDHLHGQCLLPPHVLTLRPDSLHDKEIVSFLLLEGDIFLRNLTLMPVVLSLWVGFLLSTLAPAPSLLLLLIVLMGNSVLPRGSSDYPRVLNCIEKNNYTWAPSGPSHRRKVPEPHRHLFNDISSQRPFCDQPQFCNGKVFPISLDQSERQQVFPDSLHHMCHPSACCCECGLCFLPHSPGEQPPTIFS